MSISTVMDDRKLIYLMLVFLFLLHVSVEVEGKSAAVLDSFYFDPAPVDQNVVEGSEVKLRCDVSNTRNISFSWLLNGKQLTNQSRRYQEGSDLRILRADRHLDAGVYACIATNVSAGIALRSTGAKLTVHWINGTSEIQLSKPDDADVRGGVELVLKCLVGGGEPEPSVEWYKNYAKLFSNDRVRLMKNRLRISSATRQDEGIYTCRSHNPAGRSDFSNSFVLDLESQLVLPTFTPLLIAKEGSTVHMVCQFEGSSTFWHHANKSAIDLHPKFEIMSNGTLGIEKFTKEEEGIYFCSPRSPISSPLPTKYFAARLQMAYLTDLDFSSFEPKPHQSPFHYVIPSNAKTEITCILPRGLPAPNLRWEDQYGEEVGSRSGQVMSSNGTLILSYLQENQAGNYTCIVENMAGSSRYTVSIFVSVPPKISLPPLSTKALEGGSAHFECKYTGSPHPITMVTWVKDDVPIISNQFRGNKYEENGTGLAINDVSSADEGNYACALTTVAQQPVLSPSARLYVEKRLKFKPVPVSTKLELNSNSSVACKAEGKSPTNIKWFKDLVTGLRESSNDESQVKGHNWVALYPSHVSQSLDNDLIFDGVTREDEGHYMCRATNEEQGHIDAIVHVQVVVRPKFKVLPKNTSVLMSGWAMLNCMAVGEPVPHLQWDKDGQIVHLDELASDPTSRVKIHANGSLSISDLHLTDSGRYGCTAGNNGGFERSEAFIHVIDDDDDLNRFHLNGAASDGWSSRKTAILAIFSALAYMIIIIVPTVFCVMKARKKINQVKNDIENSLFEATELADANTEHFGASDKLSAVTQDKDVSEQQQLYQSPKQAIDFGVVGRTGSTLKKVDSPSTAVKEINANQFIFVGLIGKGSYGDAYLARLTTLASKDPIGSTVIVKSYSKESRIDMDHDVNTFSNIDHENVAKILYQCIEVDRILVLSEYCAWGDLKQFLIAMQKDNKTAETKKEFCDRIVNSDDGSDGSSLRSHTYANVYEDALACEFHLIHQISLALQIACGMEYLSSRSLIHGDLASRNVLVDSRLQVKVSNLALARDPYASEYESVEVQENDGGMKVVLLPVRWMAPEVINNRASVLSRCSDVWSYGVVVWEMFTLGKMPMEELTGPDIVGLAAENPAALQEALHWPPGCPQHIWNVMGKCIQVEREARSTFAELIQYLAVDNIV